MKIIIPACIERVDWIRNKMSHTQWPWYSHKFHIFVNRNMVKTTPLMSEGCKYSNILKITYTVGELKDSTKRYLCSKTTLIASSVSGAGVIPPFCKMDTFFHRSLALSVPIYRNFQSNGGKWRSHQLWMKKFI